MSQLSEKYQTIFKRKVEQAKQHTPPPARSSPSPPSPPSSSGGGPVPPPPFPRDDSVSQKINQYVEYRQEQERTKQQKISENIKPVQTRTVTATTFINEQVSNISEQKNILSQYKSNPLIMKAGYPYNIPSLQINPLIIRKAEKDITTSEQNIQSFKEQIQYPNETDITLHETPQGTEITNINVRYTDVVTKMYGNDRKDLYVAKGAMDLGIPALIAAFQVGYNIDKDALSNLHQQYAQEIISSSRKTDESQLDYTKRFWTSPEVITNVYLPIATMGIGYYVKPFTLGVKTLNTSSKLYQLGARTSHILGKSTKYGLSIGRTIGAGVLGGYIGYTGAMIYRNPERSSIIIGRQLSDVVKMSGGYTTGGSLYSKTHQRLIHESYWSGTPYEQYVSDISHRSHVLESRYNPYERGSPTAQYQTMIKPMFDKFPYVKKEFIPFTSQDVTTIKGIGSKQILDTSWASPVQTYTTTYTVEQPLISKGTGIKYGEHPQQIKQYLPHEPYTKTVTTGYSDETLGIKILKTYSMDKRSALYYTYTEPSTGVSFITYGYLTEGSKKYPLSGFGMSTKPSSFVDDVMSSRFYSQSSIPGRGTVYGYGTSLNKRFYNTGGVPGKYGFEQGKEAVFDVGVSLFRSSKGMTFNISSIRESGLVQGFFNSGGIGKGTTLPYTSTGSGFSLPGGIFKSQSGVFADQSMIGGFPSMTKSRTMMYPLFQQDTISRYWFNVSPFFISSPQHSMLSKSFFSSSKQKTMVVPIMSTSRSQRTTVFSDVSFVQSLISSTVSVSSSVTDEVTIPKTVPSTVQIPVSIGLTSTPLMTSSYYTEPGPRIPRKTPVPPELPLMDFNFGLYGRGGGFMDELFYGKVKKLRWKKTFDIFDIGW